MSDFLISVVVCTYNRSTLLSGCINSLVEQNNPVKNFEIVIVDNKSTDDTDDIVKRFINNHDCIRLIYEEKQGLGYARNRGWREAKGKYVAYIDDDARAGKDWMSKMCDFTLRLPDVQAFGGPSFPFSKVKIPEWMPSGFGKIHLGEKERPVQIGKEWIIGCNMVFTKRILKKFGGFKNDIGMAGSKISYGEEVEFLRRIYEAGEIVYYVPQMEVDHFVSNNRLTISWLFKSSYAMGRTKARRTNDQTPIPRIIIRLAMRAIRAPMICISKGGRSIGGRVIDSLIPIVSGFGILVEAIMIAMGSEQLEKPKDVNF